MPGPTYVERARAVSPRGELVLRERRDPAGGSGALELRTNGVFVMDTIEIGTEQALARAALALLGDAASVLVGGLGLGFTLAEVLADPRVRRCTVVEIEPAVVGWLRDGTVPHGPGLLDDPRVEVVVDDVVDALSSAATAAAASYDLVLLDVDNGPDHLVHQSNAALYRVPALSAARAALRPGGVLVVWSAAEAPGLATAMTAVVGPTEAVALPVLLQGREERYWLYTARTTVGSAP